jgi:CheY-like chemotaxis protein
MGVESVVGQGSTFWVELAQTQSPLARTPAAGVPATGLMHPAPSAQKTVLYIEDNLASFQLMERIFSHWPGVKLISAMQGSLGLDLARQHHPDLILLDLHLPDIMGWDVLQRLRSEPATRAIPVVVTSADATPSQIDRLLSAGADAYLTKPLDIPKFAETVRKHLDASN